MRYSRFWSTATVLTLCLVLFYLPSVLFQLDHDDEVWEPDFLGMLLATFYTAAFLLNYFWLVPSTILRKTRLPLYFLGNLAMIVAIMVFVPFWVETHGGLDLPVSKSGEEPTLWRYVARYAGMSIRDGIMIILAAGLAYAIRLGNEKESLLKRELEISAERREIELQSLKAQLNPHFLFNSLNNIYALIEFAPDRAKEALHALSNMLRFMIYDSSGVVDLPKEAEFIWEYVELMSLRKETACRIDCDLSEELPKDARISPLLFTTLVENAFKHCGSNGIDNYIKIRLCCDSGMENSGVLVFRVENTFTERDETDEEENKSTGVGLTNVKRQLNLLYPGECKLDINVCNGIFKVELDINVKALLSAGNN